MSRPPLLLAEHRPIVREVLLARLTDEGFDVMPLAGTPWPERLDVLAACVVAPGFPEAGRLTEACGRNGVPVLQVDEEDDVGSLLDRLEELLVTAAAEKRAGRLDSVLEVRLGRLATTSELTASAQVVLKLLDGRRTLQEVFDKSSLDRRPFLTTVASLQDAGLVQPARPRTGTTLPPPTTRAVAGPRPTVASAVEPAAMPERPPAEGIIASASVAAAAMVDEPSAPEASLHPPHRSTSLSEPPVAPVAVATEPPIPAPTPVPAPAAATATTPASATVRPAPELALPTEPPPLPVRPPLHPAPAAPVSATLRSVASPTLSAIEAAEEAELAREELADFDKTRQAASLRTLALLAGAVVIGAVLAVWLMQPGEESPSMPAPPEASVATKAAEVPPAAAPEPAPASRGATEPSDAVDDVKAPPSVSPAEEPARPEPAAAEAGKQETAAAEPVKPEPVKPEPVKPEPVKPEPVKAKVNEPGADYDALVKKGREAAAKGKWQKAADAFEAALKERPTAAVAFELGRVMFDADRFPRAREAFQTVIRLEPKRAEAQFYLAVTNQNLGKDGEARKAYEAALKAGLSGAQAAEARKALKALR